MPRRDRHPAGAFSKVDLTTPDPGAAREFYAALFGWSYAEWPGPGGGTYLSAELGGDHVAGIGQRNSGPAEWASYVTVDDAAATGARAVELGGAVTMEPFAVTDAGTMAVVRDAAGAWLALWQPGRHHGAQRVNEPGALTWNDLHATGDVAEAGRFWGALLGWEIAPIPEAHGFYATVRNGERSNGGVLRDPAAGPPYWTPYFAVADLGVTAGLVRENGGAVLGEPQPVPGGAFVAVRDPQGARFSLFAGHLDD